MTYTIKTERLGLRNWRSEDLEPMAGLCANEEVMRYFPSTLTESETEAMLARLSAHFETYGFTYFAVDVLETGALIGFIGMKHQNYEVDFCPHVDIGWRLLPEYWGYGYATEGARACLAAKSRWDIPEVLSVASELNVPSWKVMERIGMTYVKNFEHPVLKEGDPLRDFRLYGFR